MLLLVLPAEAAAQVLQADFDGDGVRDAVFRGARPDVLWGQLSRTAQTGDKGPDIFLYPGRGCFRAVHAAPVGRWHTSPRVVAGAVPQSDNPSDAPAGAAIDRRMSPHGRWLSILVLAVTPLFVARQLSRGVDLRGPPHLSS